jgi:hypothetical protein
MKLEFSGQILKNSQMRIFLKIRTVEGEFFRAD